MKETVHFTKMHGAGNDYIYVDTQLYNIPDPEKAAIAWSAYHTGIGSDGLVLIGKPQDGRRADYSMRIFNADGSEAMMCGNASRCIGKYLYEKGLTRKETIRLETLSGIKILKLHLQDNKKVVESVTVDMLKPRLENPQQFRGPSVLEADDRIFEGTYVCMGNPHFVTFVDDIDTIDIAHYGKILERDEAFPQRCNIEFAQITDTDIIRTRVWERGSGITMACGTGACATAVAAAMTKRAGRKSSIVMDGGTLERGPVRAGVCTPAGTAAKSRGLSAHGVLWFSSLFGGGRAGCEEPGRPGDVPLQKGPEARCRSLFSESYPPMKRDCCTGISPCAAVPFLVLAGHGAQWRDLNWLFCISCTIIKNCEVYTRYHWERRITP